MRDKVLISYQLITEYAKYYFAVKTQLKTKPLNIKEWIKLQKN